MDLALARPALLVAILAVLISGPSYLIWAMLRWDRYED